ncbi:MAG TPA: NIPSNAP family protein [Acidimicrobiales bacterium]|nr:NIPSNAP family protein [Acidimicrobiales bacterium]
MTTARTFELRTYHSAPGRLDDISARFRDHTMALFAKHGIEVVGFWSSAALDDPQTGTLVYVCSYESRAAADAAWASFQADPAWHEAKEESERDGPIVASIESLFMEPTDYSPIS